MYAPYSQGDVVVFAQTAGQQCVAMILCGLIYHNMKGIGNPNDLKQIMHIGSQLYSSLSQLSRQSFLLLTDLPSMLTVLEEDYQLEYSESYTGKELLSHHNEKLVKARWVELCINQTKRKIREGPYFICTVCN